jgi:hypothetical protein
VVAGVLLLAGALFTTASPGTGASMGGDRIVRTRTEIPAIDSVTVGERIRITHSFIYPDSLRMRIPDEIDPGTCRILSFVWRENRTGGEIEITADVSMITLDLEEARLPAIVVDFITPSGDTLVALADEVVVPVRQMTAGATGPRPLKEQWVAPANFTKWLPAGLVLLVAAALLVWWLRRRARREIEVPPEPKLPADYIALTELSRVERMNMLERGEFKKYYTLVTDAIRKYLEARYRVDATDRTTSELLAELEDRSYRVDKLDGLLNEADLVKFARLKPGEATGITAMSTAREIVVKTKLAPAPVTENPENRALGGGGNP